MDGPSLSIRVSSFSELQSEILTGCGNKGGRYVPDQVRYLESYLRLREERARTLVIEAPYVDRHYLEEYAGYYATSLRQPPPKTTRIHVFKSQFSQQDLDAWLRLAATEGAKATEEILQPEYLGFIVVRPIPAAPIGRTVLAPYATSGDERASLRVLEAAETEHRVHLCGIDLTAKGVPFQQQDEAVGACATTAIWSALARVMRTDGARPVTPLAVTSAATARLEGDRAFPAVSGLTLGQMLDAIREFGYSPHMFEAGGGNATERAVFQLALKCYLRSGIPVILELHYDNPIAKHAVTVVGFRTGLPRAQAPAEEPSPPKEATEQSLGQVQTPGVLLERRVSNLEGRVTRLEDSRRFGVEDEKPDVRDGEPDDIDYVEELLFKREGKSFGLRSPGIARLYVHDDRLGPYARMVWMPSDDSLPRVRFAPKEHGFEDYLKPALISNAIVPLYPKLRLSASNMVQVAADVLPMMRHLAGQELRDEISLTMRYMLSGRYLRYLYSQRLLSPERVHRFATTAVLSRYVGLLHFTIRDFMFVDVICDPTDLLRDEPIWAPVIAMLPLADSYVGALKEHCGREASHVRVV